MKSLFEKIALANGWALSYGREDFHNLEQEVDAPFYLFLDPLQEDFSFKENNTIERHYISGSFLLLKKAEFDKAYSQNNNGKYELYIEPCRERIQEIIKEFMCNGFFMESMQIMEVINLYDSNFDGVLVSFKVLKE